ncbi:MAG: response regulator transcription factor [Chloroflexi bacterium]|nr:response regulator transcription factor [Chloroflexota bacterium]MCI0579640.1 response regulator transcription factor [Chloroflexota bacterium]MCI0644386.1 response regulator transcription factor [Chloroflexota bacterium]MCI0727361.1 response regulator transcription factor [Chloroflexota bacterium]
MADKEPVTYTIFVVEDHPIMRMALAKLLQRAPDLAVAGEAASAAEALQRIPQAEPDLVLVDISLPGAGGLTLVEQLHQERPELPCLVLSGHDESTYASLALQAGARGYVMKKDTDYILTAIRYILNGEIYLSEKMRQALSI